MTSAGTDTTALDTAAAEHLRGLPAYAPVLAGLTERRVESRITPSVRCGGRVFHQRPLTLASPSPSLVVEDGSGTRVLLDLDARGEKAGQAVNLVFAVPSPDGCWVVFGTELAGTEIVVLGLLDVDTGDEVPESFDVMGTFPSWAPDSRSFWFMGMEISETGVAFGAFHHVLGSGTTKVPLSDAALWPVPRTARDSDVVLIGTGNNTPRAPYISYDGTGFEPFLDDVPGSHKGCVSGDSWWGVLSDGVDRGRLVRIPLATHSDRSTWVELVPAGDDVLHTVAVFDGAIALGYFRDASCRIRLLTLDGRQIREVALPEAAYVGLTDAPAVYATLPMFHTGDDELFFVMATPTQSNAAYACAVPSGELTLLSAPPATIEGTEVRLLTATSADATTTSAHVVLPAGYDGTPRPTLIHGYGGFGLSVMPGWLGPEAEWVRAGGIAVIAHLRGGGEYGQQWWASGSHEHKQNTFNDLYALAEALRDTGLASTLAVTGESNGGLLVGAAVVQRPDLWDAAVSVVPLLDLINLDTEPLLHAIVVSEFGDPRDPAQRPHLEAYSPVQNVRPGTAYPPVLLIAGENDPRCPVWQAESFARALREATSSEHPVHLRVRQGQGHNAAFQHNDLEAVAEKLAFLMSHSGLQP